MSVFYIFMPTLVQAKTGLKAVRKGVHALGQTTTTYVYTTTRKTVDFNVPFPPLEVDLDIDLSLP